MSAETSPRRTSPEGWIAATLLLGVFLVILLQVVSRYLPFNPPVWTEELSRWLWVWLIFIGMAEVERTDSHLKMEMMSGLMSASARLLLFLAIDVACVLVFADLIWIGYKGALRNLHAASVTMPVNLVVFYAAYPVAGFLIIARVLRRIAVRLRLLRDLARGAAR